LHVAPDERHPPDLQDRDQQVQHDHDHPPRAGQRAPVAQQAREPREQLGHAESEDDRQQDRYVFELVHRLPPPRALDGSRGRTARAVGTLGRMNTATARASDAVPGLAPVTGLPGVGEALAQALARLGIERVQDLWFHLPLRYEDRTRITPIRDARVGTTVQVEGVVEAVERGFRYRPQLRVAIGDGSRATLT